MSDERSQLEAHFYLYARLNLASDARIVVDYHPDTDTWGTSVYSKGRFIGQLIARQVSGQWKIWPGLSFKARGG